MLLKKYFYFTLSLTLTFLQIASCKNHLKHHGHLNKRARTRNASRGRQSIVQSNAQPTPKRSSSRAQNLDDEGEHNITIVYDRINGLTHPNTPQGSSNFHPGTATNGAFHTSGASVPHHHKLSQMRKTNKKEHSKQRFLPQKLETTKGSKRQLLPTGSMFNMKLPTSHLLSSMFGNHNDPAPGIIDSEGAMDPTATENLVPVGPVESVLGPAAGHPANGIVQPPPMVGPIEGVLGTVASFNGDQSELPAATVGDAVAPVGDAVATVGPAATVGDAVAPVHSTGHVEEIGSNAPVLGGSEVPHNVQPQSQTIDMAPKHIYQPGHIKTQSGVINGGLLPASHFHGQVVSKQDSEQFKENDLTFHPHQEETFHHPVHVNIKGIEKQEAGFVNGGFLQKEPLRKEGQATQDTTETNVPSIVPHQTTIFNKPKHIFQAGLEKSQDGFVDGGFLQKEAGQVKMPGAHHIVRKPIHLTDPHSTTSYQTVVDHGEVHEHPCLNGGVYISMVHGTYQCICPVGYIGKTCQEKNYCHPCPCKNKGDCTQTKEEPFYKCRCKRGFYGIDCEAKDPCYPNPCRNQGVCTHDGTIASCVCPRRFRGKRCETLNNCDPDPCANGGRCVELKGEGKFQCECLPMYRGALCRKRSFCFTNPCRNGGTCREGEEHFVCDCPKGFSGPACADRMCQPNPCMNGGTCVEDGDRFKCVCLPWTTGNLCEETRPCLTNPCMHGGRCIDSFSGFHWSFGPMQYYCTCKRPFKGLNCEHHSCQNCHKNAHCEVDRCVCDEGFEGNGEQCRKMDDTCRPNPCLNKGICIPVADYCQGNTCGFKCACPAPYLPPLCKHKNPCEPDPCMNGECIPLPEGEYRCNCEVGYKGDQCSERDACHPNPCQHNGVCKDDGGKASCECVGMWKGSFCKECGCPTKSLHGSPQMMCSPQGQCICQHGYTPDMKTGVCVKQVGNYEALKPCRSSPCEHGGRCIDVSDSDFRCDCKLGYSGKVCQHKSPCQPGPCLNDGICLEKDGKFLGCKCRPGYLPPMCIKPELQDGPCRPNPCLHEGACVINGDAYDCHCPERYTGPNCNVDKCAKCDHNAECILGKCKCRPGYIGNGYTCEREMCDATCVEWSTCINGQCVCNPGYAHVSNKCVPKPVTSEESEVFEKQKEHSERITRPIVITTPIPPSLIHTTVHPNLVLTTIRPEPITFTTTTVRPIITTTTTAIPIEPPVNPNPDNDGGGGGGGPPGSNTGGNGDGGPPGSNNGDGTPPIGEGGGPPGSKQLGPDEAASKPAESPVKPAESGSKAPKEEKLDHKEDETSSKEKEKLKVEAETKLESQPDSPKKVEEKEKPSTESESSKPESKPDSSKEKDKTKPESKPETSPSKEKESGGPPGSKTTEPLSLEKEKLEIETELGEGPPGSSEGPPGSNGGPPGSSSSSSKSKSQSGSGPPGSRRALERSRPLILYDEQDEEDNEYADHVIKSFHRRKKLGTRQHHHHHGGHKKSAFIIKY
ncbi:uncharacterized protein [Clytia hemisphaerica]|uniref:EGF-like domain-containing protein n=1 Tax=Clytia hemisphaerica TaxID=252671 RepID=A0A7M5VD20_9CNID